MDHIAIDNDLQQRVGRRVSYLEVGMFMEPVWRKSYRLHIRPAALAMGARIVTALVGGYASASALATLAARLLPIDRADATGWAMILSFLVYAGLGLWAFHERRLARVALTIWGSTLVSGGVLFLLGVRP